MQIKLTVDKESVFREVEKATNYTGTKLEDGDQKAYERIATTDADRQMLDTYWAEACNAVNDQVKPFIVVLDGMAEGYDVTLDMSSAYDTNLTESVNASLGSYFTAAITAKWFGLSNKKEAGQYAEQAAGMLDDVMRKIYYKRRPKRVAPKLTTDNG